jgi:nucleotide-binding universal stress UspA family protein
MLAPAPIHHILFPSDLSQASDLAFDHARLIAEAFTATVTLYHVLEVKRRHELEDAVEREHLRRAERAAREHLDRQALRVTTLGRVIVERTSSPAEAMIALIEACSPDLTVMATHGRGNLAQLVLGGVTERVARASAPVLCVREPEHGSALPYRRVLVPTDLSPASRRAFPLAAALAGRFGAEVLALHVASGPTGASLSGIPDFVERSLPSEQALLAFLDPAFREVAVRARVELGSPWDRIVETARQERVDLIVMSTHGHDSISDRLLGSHTERVVRHAPCPVLVV